MDLRLVFVVFFDGVVVEVEVMLINDVFCVSGCNFFLWIIFDFFFFILVFVGFGVVFLLCFVDFFYLYSVLICFFSLFVLLI